MRTTIDLPDPLFRRIKTKAATEGTSLKALITRFVEQGLTERYQQSAHGRAARSPLPVIRSETVQTTLPALSSADIETLLAQGDAERIGRE